LLHMEQNLTFEVVDILLKEEAHLRLLAKKLKVNHMTINRRLKELMDVNVVDFQEAGKNKTYYLKKTVEARSYIFMAEHYKLVKALDSHPHLRRIVDGIQDNSRVDVALLFGSYAKNTATKDSDIDIYVESKNKKIKTELEDLDSRLSIKIGDYDKDNLLAKEIEKNHVIIKCVERYYEKTGFFG